MTRPNTITCDLKTAERINKAVMKVGRLQKKVRPKYADYVSHASPIIREVLSNAREYVLQNVGKNPPLDHFLVFEHSAGTISRIEKARQNLRAIWSLIPPSKQREAGNTFADVMQVLKDLRMHVNTMMKDEG